MKNIMEIDKFLNDLGMLLKGISKTTENKGKEQESGFRGIIYLKL